MLKTDRRALLGGMGAAGAMALIGGCTSMAGGRTPFFTRIGKPIGIQTYALGPEVADDLGGTFAMLASLGFGELELPGLYGRPAAEVRRLADEAGLAIASLHVQAGPFPGRTDTLANDAQALFDTAKVLGAPNVVIPMPAMPADFAPQQGEDFVAIMQRAFSSAGAEHWRVMAGRFNAYGAAARANGLRLGYHNHNLEFAPVGDTTGWDILMDETDPDLVKVELDIGWVQQAGLDPLTELTKLGSRVIALHVKDVAAGYTPSYYFAPNPTEVGSGVVDWARILPAAQAAGVDHYFVEQEPPFTMPRPDAAAKSIAFLQSFTG